MFGYSWVGLLHIALGLSFRDTLLLANASSMAWLGVYYFLLEPPERKGASRQLLRTDSEAAQPDDHAVELAAEVPRDQLPHDQASPLLEQQSKCHALLSLPSADSCANDWHAAPKLWETIASPMPAEDCCNSDMGPD